MTETYCIKHPDTVMFVRGVIEVSEYGNAEPFKLFQYYCDKCIDEEEFEEEYDEEPEDYAPRKKSRLKVRDSE